MNTENIELLASHWTIGGRNVYPGGPTQISSYTFQDRVKAVAEAGFKGISLYYQCMMNTADTLGFTSMKSILDEHGITRIELDYLLDWYHTGERRRESDKARQELLLGAKELGADTIKILGGLFEDEADLDLMVREFKLLCQQAAAVGTNVALEIVPMSNVRTIDTALAVVEGANEPNGGMLLDIWNLSRGGIDFSEIAKVPARFIKSVELADAYKYAVSPLWEDAVHNRCLPGEGSFDVPAFIKAIQATGYTGYWGVEIISAAHRKLPLEQRANGAFQASINQFNK